MEKEIQLSVRLLSDRLHLIGVFSLIACISLRDLFIKRILHFKISGSV